MLTQNGRQIFGRAAVSQTLVKVLHFGAVRQIKLGRPSLATRPAVPAHRCLRFMLGL